MVFASKNHQAQLIEPNEPNEQTSPSDILIEDGLNEDLPGANNAALPLSWA
jgi:hypothetical protein